MKVKKLIVRSDKGKYPILIGSNLISKLSKIAKENSIFFDKCLLFIDRNVPRKILSKINSSLKKKKNMSYFSMLMK